ncbi:MAG: alpha/beta hydrolase [Lysobacterales bacterium]|jgi:pimeloyl-ACP methyl ester carboxylesterase|nr:MAG: alpha/beta hydrolase [Xanthomonadales bacterium]
MASAAAVLGLALLPYLVPLPEREPWPGASPFPNGEMVEACGIRWHVQVWRAGWFARGRAILLHGLGGSSFSWRYTGPALADAGFDAIAIDLPPWGYSERRKPRGDLATCLVELADRVGGPDPVAAIGHSMGASVASLLAERLGSRAFALVLVDGVPQGRRAGRGLFGLLSYPPFSRYAELFAHWRLLGRESFARSLSSAYGRPATAEEVEGYLRPLKIAGTAGAVFAFGFYGGGGGRWDQPTLLIWGREDRWVPPQVAERFLARFPSARIAWIEEAAHNPMETHPQAFHDALLGFLSESIRSQPLRREE